ncbi:hypothetical protein AVEN_175898-1 [Araneus ventricosus]|uniref:Uncharacterized protein n=1 Tax=Araneus ventricosus TaxID=182803 RepID=A0A4Y2EFU6_ARAVE|nr:hypothetical protein AVEN_175898-1 [Araneus ventricosus]
MTSAILLFSYRVVALLLPPPPPLTISPPQLSLCETYCNSIRFSTVSSRLCSSRRVIDIILIHLQSHDLGLRRNLIDYRLVDYGSSLLSSLVMRNVAL